MKPIPASSSPSICVISITLNAERTIERTISSVLAQSFPPDEYLVIDGGSTDRTVAIAREHLPSSGAVVSEPDDGIYDAMNRGLRIARSDVVGFLNANDVYAAPDVLQRVRATLRDPAVDACFGHLDMVDLAGKTVRQWRTCAFKPGLLTRGWVPPHPTFYCRRKVLLDTGGFRKHYRIAGDYELFLRLFAVAQIRAAFIPEVLIRMEAGGVSNASLRNIVAANREVVKAWRENGLIPPPLIGLRKPLTKMLQLRPGW